MWFWYQPFHTFIMTYVVGQNGQVFTPLFTDKNGMGGPVAHELSMYSDRIRYFPLKFSMCVRQKLCELFKLNLFLFNFSILFLVLKEVVGSTVQSITEIFIIMQYYCDNIVHTWFFHYCKNVLLLMTLQRQLNFCLSFFVISKRRKWEKGEHTKYSPTNHLLLCSCPCMYKTRCLYGSIKEIIKNGELIQKECSGLFYWKYYHTFLLGSYVFLFLRF